MSRLDSENLLATLAQLRATKIAHSIHSYREDAVSIIAYVPGERWEIDFLVDGSVEVEVFASDGGIHGMERLADLFARFSE